MGTRVIGVVMLLLGAMLVSSLSINLIVGAVFSLFGLPLIYIGGAAIIQGHKAWDRF